MLAMRSGSRERRALEHVRSRRAHGSSAARFVRSSPVTTATFRPRFDSRISARSAAAQALGIYTARIGDHLDALRGDPAKVRLHGCRHEVGRVAGGIVFVRERGPGSTWSLRRGNRRRGSRRCRRASSCGVAMAASPQYPLAPPILTTLSAKVIAPSRQLCARTDLV